MTFIIAEMSANHNGSYHRALDIIRAAKYAGADAVKIQLYTPDTLTIDCAEKDFVVAKPWEGETLYSLYQKAHMPWSWVGGLCDEAEKVGIEIFPTVYDKSSLEFAECYPFKRYKISSFEIVDIQLLRLVAKTGKPIILSTGGASVEEIDLAVETIAAVENEGLTLLKCTSAYPALPDSMDLIGIQRLSKRYCLPVGLSNHSLGATAAIAAVALGATVLEHHFSLDGAGVDGVFSMNPGEFKVMVDSIREVEKMLQPCPVASPSEFRKSIYAISDIKAGERFGPSNVRVIRPGYGLAPKHWDSLIGRVAKCNIKYGTALDMEMVA